MLEHPGIKPPGAANFFRLDGLGPDYDYDSLRRRIVENTLVPGTPLLFENDSSSYDEKASGSGLPYTYRRYCIRLYSFICKPTNSKREYIPMALREDIAKLDRYIEQMDFLCQHRIEDKVSLQVKKDKLVSELKLLIVERRKLNTEKEKAVRYHDFSRIEQSKDEISDVSRKIRELRKEIKLCNEVFISSDKVIGGLDRPTAHPTIEAPKSIARSNPLQARERF